MPVAVLSHGDRDARSANLVNCAVELVPLRQMSIHTASSIVVRTVVYATTGHVMSERMRYRDATRPAKCLALPFDEKMSISLA